MNNNFTDRHPYFPPNIPGTDGPVPGTGPEPNIIHPHRPGPPPPRPDMCHRDLFMESQMIQNVAQMRQYIKQQLGAPVICIEISDQQLNNVIVETVQYLWKYYIRVGKYRDYLMMELVPGKTHYKLCDELESIIDFQCSDWLGSINELFTVPHNALYDTLMTMNGSSLFKGSCYGNSAGYGDMLGNWNASLLWLEQAKMDFGESYTVRYNVYEKELAIWPTPQKPVRGLMEVYRRQHSIKLFNELMFKRMATARAGMIWTNALRKYQITIAGGGTLNADSLYSSYKEEYDACVEQIRLESPLQEFWVQ